MKILGIDSSSLVASAAVIEDELLVAEYTVNLKKTHSKILMPMIAEISKMIDLDINTIDAIAVAGGPGSFTGLRIGSATAKGLGLALDKPIINVPTLEAMAYNLYGTEKIICPIMDARRNQVYTGVYKFTDDRLTVIKEQSAVSVETLIDYLNARKEYVIIMGDGVPVYKDILEDKLTVQHDYAKAHVSRQRASSVAALGVEYYRIGKIETAAEHTPAYLRLSQAEREMRERNGKIGND